MIFRFYHFLIIFCALSLFVMGLVMIFNTSSADALDHDLSHTTHQALFKQMLYGAVGLSCGVAVWHIGYRRLVEASPLLLAFFSLLLVLTLIPGIGREVNGSRRWIQLAGFSLQPSEFVKYLLPAYCIYRLKNGGEVLTSFGQFFKLASLLAIPLLLILVEPNNGTAAVAGLLLLLLCFIAGVRIKYWVLPLSLLLAIGALSAYQLPYVAARLNVYMHPELDLTGKGHQPHQAKIASGAGRMWGRGPGKSLQKLSYLPEAQNDYIAAIYAEEFGFAGILVLIFLYTLIAYAGFYIAYTASDKIGCYFATVIFFLISFQAFMNLGVVSGLLPSTGLNLPFFSQGGSSLIANSMGAAILLSVHKNES